MPGNGGGGVSLSYGGYLERMKSLSRKWRETVHLGIGFPEAS